MPEKKQNLSGLKEFLSERLSTSEDRTALSTMIRGPWSARSPLASQPSTTPYQAIIANALARVSTQKNRVQGQRDLAPALFEELMQHPEERRQVLVRNSARFQNWHLCTLLTEDSLRSTSRHPRRAVHMAMLAIEVVNQLNVGDFAPGALADLKARCWSCLSNARRFNGEVIRAAEESMRRAEEFLAQGTGDPLEEARLLSLKAPLAGVRGQFRECFALFDRVAAIYRHYGEDHFLGRTLLKKGAFCNKAGDLEQALELFQQALELVDVEREPRWMLAATHNLMLTLTDMGRHEEASQILEEKRPFYQQLGTRLDLMRLRWLEGRIARSHGQMDQAEEAFAETRTAYIREGIALDAALVSLEMAVIYLEQGRTGEIKKLAEEILPFFKASDLHRQAFAALILFQKAAEMERVTLSLIQDAMAKLLKLRHT